MGVLSDKICILFPIFIIKFNIFGISIFHFF